MKKRNYLALIAFTALSIVSCSKDNDDQILPTDAFVEIPDVNFEKKLISLGIDSDQIVNNLILKSDAEAVEKLAIEGQEITDLTGIESFVNLKRLFAAGNVINAVNLSNNVLLDSVDLSGNNLITIDFQSNTKLVYVALYGNQLLTASGFSNADNLDNLSLSFNYLTEFSVENPSLTKLQIDNNDLISFDAEMGTNLEHVVMYSNKLKTVDFSNSLKLKLLRVADNKLTNIILGQKNDLYHLSCSSNFLTTLNVADYANLDYLYVQNNPNLNCIQIANGQVIGTKELSANQALNTNCN